MSKENPWELVEPEVDVWRLAHHLNRQAESIDFSSTLQDEDDTEAFYTMCEGSLPFFAPRCLFVKGKDAKRHNFEFNRAQWYLHTVAEWMRHKYGYVRIIIVKGRQQGISTYLEGRAYWKVIHRENYNVLIMTHEQKATDNLFAMSKRYHTYCPSDLQPLLGASNAKELRFPDLDSQYLVATAGAGGTGRSQSAHFFHGSEVAFWADAAEHASGILQAIGLEDETEVFLESTADGIANYFHEMWQTAEPPREEVSADGNGYIRVFIPWFWDPGYHMEPPEDFACSEEEAHYKWLHGLTDDQIFWRRRKIAEMDNDPNRFKRDYPATPEEAFESSGDNILIRADLVAAARRNGLENRFQPVGAVVMGVDVARQGDDATAFVIRQGRVILHRSRMVGAKANDVATRLLWLKGQYGVEHTFIDGTGGYGTAVYDVLVDRGKAQDMTCVHFSSAADEPERFANVRTEMWWRIKLWMEAGAQITNDPDWGRDLCAPQYKYQREMIQLESKDDIKKRIKRSPDVGDALALTFRFPIQSGGNNKGYHEPDMV